MGDKILITGASGLIGSKLVNLLLAKEYEVNILGRKKVPHVRAKSFVWNIDEGTVDKSAFEDVGCIIHMAGAGIADSRWTAKRKKEILNSRVKSAKLIHKTLSEMEHRVETFVSASAVGYYGQGIGGEFLENVAPAKDFLGHTCMRWEESADLMEELGLRVVKIRIGIVLASGGGALPKLVQPVKLGVGAPLGTGKQAMPWIHITDLLSVFVKAVEDISMFGAFNVASPNQVTNKEFIYAVARACKRKILLPNVPSFVLKVALGEMAAIVLGGNFVNVDKILQTGFKFTFSNLDLALKNLLEDKE